MQQRFRAFYIGALAVTGAALVATSFVPRAQADTWNKLTIVTVNEPIIAGNKVLDPGTYVWKLMDSPANRHIVQIFDKDQRHLETTILAIPNYRLQPKGNSRFAFWETPVGVPKAVRAWFYPGDNFGQEFAYPKKLVAQLAAAAPTPIPSAYREPEPASAPLPEPPPAAEAAPVPVPPAPVAQAPENPRPAPAPAVSPSPEPRRAATLPHTASFDPLIGVLGLASLGLAGALSISNKKC